MKYTTDGLYEVKAGKIVIARSYVSPDGYEIKIRQGMDRTETIDKIAADCPEFLINNNWDLNRVPKLFTK